MRYLYDNPELNESFASAFQLEADVGNGEEISAVLDTRTGSAILEILNILPEAVVVALDVYNQLGESVETKTVKLSGHASYHYIAGASLKSEIGLAVLKGNKPKSACSRSPFFRA